MEWSGGLYVITVGIGYVGGVIGAKLESECIGGKKGFGLFLMLMAGVPLGHLPVNQSIGKFTMKTPGIYGPSPWTLIGPFAWIVVTGAYGVGLSFTATMYMGMGIGTLGFNWAYGFDFGFDMMGGISIPVYIHKKDNC